MEIDIVRLHPCTQFLWSGICLKIRKALSTLARFVCILHVQGWKEQHMRQLHLGQIVWCQWFCSDFPHFPQNQSNYIIAVQQRETSYFWTAGISWYQYCLKQHVWLPPSSTSCSCLARHRRSTGVCTDTTSLCFQFIWGSFCCLICWQGILDYNL